MIGETKGIINGKYGGRCGPAIMVELIRTKDGGISLVENRGYQKGDLVEEYFSDEGHSWDVDKVVCNGKIIYERDENTDQRKKEQQENYMRETLQAKGIKHPIYNP